MEFTFSLLREDGSHACIWGIHLHDEGFVEIQLGEDGGGGKTLFQMIECLSGCLPPLERNLRGSEVSKRWDNFAEVTNEATIEICKPQKTLKLLVVWGCGPLQIRFDLSRIRSQVPSSQLWNQGRKRCLHETHTSLLWQKGGFPTIFVTPVWHVFYVLPLTWRRWVYCLGRRKQSGWWSLWGCHSRELGRLLVHLLIHRHDEIFKMYQVGVEGRLPLVPLPNANQMISTPVVKFTEYLHPVE